MRAITLLLLALLTAAAAPAGAQLVTDLSQDKVKVTYRYQGEKLLVFGGLPEPGGDVVVEVRGPAKPRTVQHKGKVGGLLWMNVDHLTFHDVPGYYALLSNRPLARIAPGGSPKGLGIGVEALFEQASWDNSGKMRAEPRAFFDGLIRGLKRDDLFLVREGGVSLREDRLFRAELPLPSKVPTGEYEIITRVLRGGQVVYRDERSIAVAKTGIEEWLFDLAYEQPYWYGAMSVVVALLAGWLVGMITRGEGEH
jgi:uncharacterized protein (TIGR02186 family)